MKRIQKAIFAEASILEQHQCTCEQVPHLFLVKKEDNQELLEDLLENQKEGDSRRDETARSDKKSRVVHLDHRYYDNDVESKSCDVLIHPSGWKFYSFHRHILQEHEIQQLLVRMKHYLLSSFPSVKNSLSTDEARQEWISSDHLDVNGYKLHLPPVLFGVDVMFLEFHPSSLPSDNQESGNRSTHFALSVDPSDSILSWVVKHCQENLEKHSLNIPKVPYSEKWLQNIQEDFKVTTIDSNLASPSSTPKTMTPSTSTRSTAVPTFTPEPSRGKHSTNTPPATDTTTDTTTSNSTTNTPQREPLDSITLTHIQPSDWTYSTDYCLTAFFESLPDELSLSVKEKNEIYGLKQILRARELSTLASTANPVNCPIFPSPLCQIEAVTTSGINYEMLKRRDLPILFYDEIILYEDDLEDCGEVSMDAKIRVMPTCWFLLIRFFVRIDNVIVRSREVRLFHDFATITSDKMTIAMEVIWREKDLTVEAPAAPLSGPHSSPMMSNIHTSLAATGNTTLASSSTTSSSHHHHFKGALPPPPMMMMKKYTKENMQELPIINEREGIPPNYLIHIV